MGRVNAEEELVEAVQERLAELGADVDAPQPGRTTPDLGADLVVRLPGRDGPVEVAVEIKAQERAIAPAVLRQQAARLKRPVILAQRRISRHRAEQYRSDGIQFIDSGGNAWIDFPGFQVQIEGRSPRVDAPDDRRTRAFTPAGLRVTFALLINPELQKATVREIAASGQVSVGAAQAALVGLEADGHLVGRGRRAKLINEAQLAHRWVDQYSLRAAADQRSLAGPAPSWWIQHLGETDAFLSGEAAMQHLGYGIRPLTTTLYADELRTIVRHGKLRSAGAEGESNVFLRTRFWADSGIERPVVAPSLLIYADSVASGDPRQIEVAETFWENDGDLRRLREG